MFRCWFDAVTLFKPVFVVIVNNQSTSPSVRLSSVSQSVRPSVSLSVS